MHDRRTRRGERQGNRHDRREKDRTFNTYTMLYIVTTQYLICPQFPCEVVKYHYWSWTEKGNYILKVMLPPQNISISSKF